MTEQLISISEEDRIQVIRDWAFHQVKPWSLGVKSEISKESYQKFLSNINENSHNVFIVDFNNGIITVRPKNNPHVAALPGSLEYIRIKIYLDFISAVVNSYQLNECFTIALCVGDIYHDTIDFPVFGFQKKPASRLILMPDPDFMQLNFYQETSIEEDHNNKLEEVVFCGSSTGKMLSVSDILSDNSERLRYAEYFRAHQNITVKIGAATQCLSDEAREMLERKSYFQSISWNDQLKRKYILSMDGNGATCSRVVLTLKSQSVLLKVESDHSLYYFVGLRPFKEYIPVKSPEDLEELFTKISRSSINTKKIVDDANKFYRNFLNRVGVEEYTYYLLSLFAELQAEYI